MHILYSPSLARTDKKIASLHLVLEVNLPMSYAMVIRPDTNILVIVFPYILTRTMCGYLNIGLCTIF